MSASPGSSGAPVTSVAAAIARMEQIDRSLPAADGVACFNRMYLEVTQTVEERIGQGFFADPAFMTHLDVVFANLYFAAVAAMAGPSSGVPAAWAPLVEARSTPGIFPIQFALAGMNAHINHDLPAALVRTCTDLATAPEDGSHNSDYQKVDALLDAAEQSIRQSFESSVVLATDRRAQVVLDLVCNWSMNTARDVAWDLAVALWRCRDVALWRICSWVGMPGPWRWPAVVCWLRPEDLLPDVERGATPPVVDRLEP
jgi:hypothetical protein